MSWNCALCNKPMKWYLPRTWPSDTSIPTGPGSGGIVCKGCEKDRQDAITKRNEMAYGGPEKKKDPNCPHTWLHPWRSRWYCSQCGAQFNWTCRHGGSEYACAKCEYEFKCKMVREEGSVDAFLTKHSW